MSRFIDADILKELVEEEFDEIVVYNVPPDEAVADICDIIKSCPTADAAPVIQGHWIINSDSYYPQCSNCMGEPESGKMTKFCPNCGAKMEDKDDGR